MQTTEKHTPIRALVLITTPKSAKKAADMFAKGEIPMQYQWNAMGTAPNEMIDILGLGAPNKSVLISVIPKPLADEMLKKLKRELRLGSVNSGIAFTLPLTGANNLVLRMLEQLSGNAANTAERKDEHTMANSMHSLIVAVINQGFSEDVMDTARAAGAGGGTIVHSRSIGNKEAMGFWGMSIQEEKDMLFIVVKNEEKLKIMQAIGDKFGMRSEAKGIVLSLPIDTVLGLEDI